MPDLATKMEGSVGLQHGKMRPNEVALLHPRMAATMGSRTTDCITKVEVMAEPLEASSLSLPRTGDPLVAILVANMVAFRARTQGEPRALVQMSVVRTVASRARMWMAHRVWVQTLEVRMKAYRVRNKV